MGTGLELEGALGGNAVLPFPLKIKIFNNDYYQKTLQGFKLEKQVFGNGSLTSCTKYAQTFLQLPLWQWGADNVYLLVLSSLKVNIAENPIAVMGL